VIGNPARAERCPTRRRENRRGDFADRLGPPAADRERCSIARLGVAWRRRSPWDSFPGGMMEPYRLPGYPAVLGDLAYGCALALFVLLQRMALKLRAEEADTWWASNGRDAVNGLAVVTLSAAIWLQGVAPWLAIFFGGTLTLALSGLHSLLQRTHATEPWKPVVVAAAILGAPLVLAPRPVAETAAELLRAAFGT